MRQLLAGAAPQDQEQLRALEAEGLFVVRDGEEYRPLRALGMVRAARRAAAYQRRATAVPLSVRMFGRFRAEIDERPIEWIRRRDQQIFKFVALSHSGSADARAELAQTFWPEAEKHLVAQSLRTACSNIRKAIARVAGYDYVDLYFRADHTSVSLDLNNVVVDARKFLAHTEDGLHQYDRNDFQTAYAHYRLAEQVYVGELLGGEGAEPWITTRAAMLEGRHLMVVERLAELAVALGDYGSAVVYARKFAEMVPDSDSARHLLELAVRQARTHRVKNLGEPRTTAALPDDPRPFSHKASVPFYGGANHGRVGGGRRVAVCIVCAAVASARAHRLSSRRLSRVLLRGARGGGGRRPVPERATARVRGIERPAADVSKGAARYRTGAASRIRAYGFRSVGATAVRRRRSDLARTSDARNDCSRRVCVRYRAICWLMRDHAVPAAQGYVRFDVVTIEVMWEVQRLLAARGVRSPLVVTSGYRCAHTNANVEGAARNSQHLSAKAVDMYVPGVSMRDLFAACWSRGLSGAMGY